MLLLASTAEPVTIDHIAPGELATRRSLVAAGERLFGEHGLEGAALHKIAFAAGQANKYAVQYHFGGQQGLVDTIFAWRQRAMDMRRAALLDQAVVLGKSNDITALLEALYLPTAEQVDGRGRHSYARFALQYLSRPNYDHYSDPRTQPHTGPTGKIYGHLASVLALDYAELTARLHLTNYMMYAALLERDGRAREDVAPVSIDNTVARMTPFVAAVMASRRS
ncbi:MAG: hypothetical protein AB7E60_11655 [Sphingobium sp.]